MHSDNTSAVSDGDDFHADGITAVSDTDVVSSEDRGVPAAPESMASGDADGDDIHADGITAVSKRDKQQQIIDRFLRDNPRIAPLRESIPEPEVVKKSLQDESNLVSETLAEVLLKQGKPEKACDIYEKLCLKYPEKSSYFAALIKKANKERNI
jgi:hypothetical protein